MSNPKVALVQNFVRFLMRSVDIRASIHKDALIDLYVHHFSLEPYDERAERAEQIVELLVQAEFLNRNDRDFFTAGTEWELLHDQAAQR